MLGQVLIVMVGIGIGLSSIPTATGGEETVFRGRRSVALENASATVVIDIAGGSFRVFQLKEAGINPLNWGWQPVDETVVDSQPRVMGHFLCLDRWGPPSEAEGRNGMPYHGEAGRVVWNIDSADAPGLESAEMAVAMSAELPLAGFQVRRRVQLSDAGSVFRVEESVRNVNALGRIYNMVQHPSIGPPFLDDTTVVDCNGRRGFAQGGRLPEPEEPSFYWPQAIHPDGQWVSIRHLKADDRPNVVSYAIDEPRGWVTAWTPKHRLLIGYTWKTSDYPWVDLWRRSEEGRPVARGLEFGTTGLHQPFPILTRKGRIFGRPIFDHLDAGEEVTRSFACFLLRPPADFAGVADVRVQPGAIIVHERGGSGRTLDIPTDGLAGF